MTTIASSPSRTMSRVSSFASNDAHTAFAAFLGFLKFPPLSQQLALAGENLIDVGAHIMSLLCELFSRGAVNEDAEIEPSRGAS